jgi:hypothetical protein
MSTIIPDNNEFNRRTLATPLATADVIAKRISWGAVFAGALVALVVQISLSLLGLGIGMGTVDPMEEANPLRGLGTGAIIWWAISMLLALFAGGYVAGHLAGVPRKLDSSLHGVLTWCLFTMVSLYLLTTAVGRIMSGVGNVLGTTASLVGQGVSAVAPEAAQAIRQQAEASGIDLTDLKREGRELLAQTGKENLQLGNLEQRAQRTGEYVEGASGNAAENPQAAGQTMDQVIDRLFSEGKDVVSEVDRDAAINVVAARTGKSRAESARIVDNWITTYQNTRAKVGQTAQEARQKALLASDKAAEATSKAGIYGFLGLLLAGAAAFFGARLATPNTLMVGGAV